MGHAAGAEAPDAARDALASLAEAATLSVESDLSFEADPERLRVAAAERLLMREAPGTRDLFHEQMRDVTDGLLLQTVVDGLLTVGDEASIPVLEELQSRTEDPELQALIREVVATLERR